jgi:hypothetical protein
MEHASFSGYLSPSDEKGFYKFGFTADMEDCSAVSPEKKWVEPLGRFKKVKGEFNLDHLSSTLIEKYCEFIVKAGHRERSQSGKSHADPAPIMLELGGEFMQSKPIISVAVPQLEHYLGVLEAEARFQFSGIFAPPVGSATVTLHDLSGIEEKIGKEPEFPPEGVAAAMDVIKKYFVSDAGGDAKLVFEIRGDKPNFYLNGQPIQAIPGSQPEQHDRSESKASKNIESPS